MKLQDRSRDARVNLAAKRLFQDFGLVRAGYDENELFRNKNRPDPHRDCVRRDVGERKKETLVRLSGHRGQLDDMRGL